MSRGALEKNSPQWSPKIFLEHCKFILFGTMVPQYLYWNQTCGFRFLQRCVKSLITRRGYIAPEFIDKQQISYKTDIYSLGMMMINLLTRRTGSTTDNVRINFILIISSTFFSMKHWLILFWVCILQLIKHISCRPHLLFFLSCCYCCCTLPTRRLTQIGDQVQVTIGFSKIIYSMHQKFKEQFNMYANNFKDGYVIEKYMTCIPYR